MTDKDDEIVYLSLENFRLKQPNLEEQLEKFPVQKIEEMYQSAEWHGELFNWALPVSDNVYEHMANTRGMNPEERNEYIKSIEGEKLEFPKGFRISNIKSN